MNLVNPIYWELTVCQALYQTPRVQHWTGYEHWLGIVFKELPRLTNSFDRNRDQNRQWYMWGVRGSTLHRWSRQTYLTEEIWSKQGPVMWKDISSRQRDDRRKGPKEAPVFFVQGKEKGQVVWNRGWESPTREKSSMSWSRSGRGTQITLVRGKFAVNSINLWVPIQEFSIRKWHCLTSSFKRSLWTWIGGRHILSG